MALQPKRTLGYLRNFEISDTDKIQLVPFMLHAQQGGTKILKTIRNNKMHPTQTARLQPDRSLHPISIQWSGRRSFKNKTSTRVAPETWMDFPRDPARSRFICFVTVGSRYLLPKSISEDAPDEMRQIQYTDASSGWDFPRQLSYQTP